jgi:hypothetical protein
MKRDRTQLAFGLVLILIGAWFVAVRQVPSLGAWVERYMDWPLNIVAGGAILLLLGLLLGAPGMAVPAAIVAGIGGILYYQNTTGDWDSWSFLWTLIPGFVGVGSLLAGFLSRSSSQAKSGANLVVISAVLFLIFSAIMGRFDALGAYTPAILLILVGAWVFIRGLWRK